MINLYQKPKEAVLTNTFRVAEIYDLEHVDEEDVKTFKEGSTILVLGEFEDEIGTQCVVFCPTVNESTTISREFLVIFVGETNENQ